MRMRVALAGTVATVSMLCGCTDLTPLQNQVKDLQSQVARLSQEQAAMKTTVDNTARTARDAADTANRASSKADQALALAHTNQTSIEGLSEKLDRMFKRRLSK